MGFLQRIKDWLSAGEDSSAYWIYVQCDACQEHLCTRVDLLHDLSVRYGRGGQEDVYYTRKTLIGSGPCFNPIEVTLTFDRHRQIIKREIQGGRFLTAEEYRQDESRL